MSYWQGRNVFVTGANGFVGSWLARSLLAEGSHIVALVRDELSRGGLRLLGVHDQVSVVRGCLEDLPLVERVLNEYEVEVCFHLAAQAIVRTANRSPMSTFSSNILGTWHVLEACRRTPSIRCVVAASSDKAYGQHERLPYLEDDSLQPVYPYDVSKACADMLARCYYGTYGLPVGITRCANLYGGGDTNFSRIIPDSIRSILYNRNPVIHSDGSPVRDYLYIEDGVTAYLSLAAALAAGQNGGEVFNFGADHPVSVLELVHTLITVSGRTHLTPIVEGCPEAGEITRQYLNSDKAKHMLGWQPRHTLEQGLAATFGWYKEYFGGPRDK